MAQRNPLPRSSLEQSKALGRRDARRIGTHLSVLTPRLTRLQARRHRAACTIAPMEMTMRKTMVSALGILLIAGSAALITSASARPAHRAAANEQFRDS